MATKKDGGPAFPVREWPSQSGMSLRDWFAGHALSGVLSSHETQLACLMEAGGPNADFQETMSKNSYLLADAMLAERKKAEGS